MKQNKLIHFRYLKIATQSQFSFRFSSDDMPFPLMILIIFLDLELIAKVYLENKDKKI